ncbi:NADH-quinone oxidoreductase subunit C [bacterium]|nr:NADH-quinone oxidoreductase subunit C [bacterium]
MLFGMPVVIMARGRIPQALLDLKVAGFGVLHDLTANEKKEGLEVVYQLLRLSDGARGTLKAQLPHEQLVMPSVVAIHPGAEWHEREVFDMFGISFSDHPDLRRILLPEDWEGHPLRKDYPVGGFKDTTPLWAFEEAASLQKLPERTLLEEDILKGQE